MRRGRQRANGRAEDRPEERFLHLGSGYFLDRETGRVVAL